MWLCRLSAKEREIEKKKKRKDMIISYLYYLRVKQKTKNTSNSLCHELSHNVYTPF